MRILGATASALVLLTAPSGDEGTGDIRFKGMICEAADRAVRRLGFAQKSRR